MAGGAYTVARSQGRFRGWVWGRSLAWLQGRIASSWDPGALLGGGGAYHRDLIKRKLNKMSNNVTFLLFIISIHTYIAR